MSELAVRNGLNSHGAELALADKADAAVARLQAWAEAAQATHRMAENLVNTSFVPQAFRGKPMEATAAMLAGAEVGLNPMAALRSFDVIQGTAAPRANTLRAIVQGAGHEIVLVESTETRAIVRGRRRGETNWQKSEWTIDRAKKLKLTGKDNWQNQPQAMLVARATAECCRLVAMDAIMGIPYASEELADGEVLAPVELDAAASKPRTRKMQRSTAPAPEPELEAEAVEMINPEQMAKLQILFKERGIHDRDERLAEVTDIIGRTVGSANELTKREASKVIDRLTPLPEPPASDEPEFDEQSGGTS